ncbi:hypothetical protein QOZ80_5BG0417010 [Eleusine coracana subsp. coracana]|nr:hypothetical protein QOZ80_5BG0417010 [Eleusine coracana subsp. coracana]
MGTCRVAALVVLLLASALLPSTASSRVLEGEASSGKGAPPPAVTASGSPKSGSPKESGQSSAAGQQAESKKQQEAPPPIAAAKDSKQPSTDEGKKKGQEGDGSQTSVTSPPPLPPVQKKDAQKESPPPPPVQEKDAQKENPPPPPGGSGQNDEGEAKGGTYHEDTGNKGKDDATEKLKEVMEKCDVSHKCTIGEEFSACLQVSDSASIQSVVVVLNKGKNDITVTVKEPSNIDIGKSSLHLAKGAYGQMAVKNISPDGGKITLNDGNRDCIIHVSQPVSDWQQQFQQFAAYATRLNPIYGAYLFGFTVVLVGVVCLCCKFARRRGNGGVPYQQLEMSAPAPNSSGANNTTSTADGWDDGWDDDWDDEEAPARPSDKKPASSVSANGLSLRSRSENKDGWDVDWDD